MGPSPFPCGFSYTAARMIARWALPSELRTGRSANSRRTAPATLITESGASIPSPPALLETPPRRPPRWTIHAAAIELRTALGARGAGSRCLSRSVRMYWERVSLAARIAVRAKVGGWAAWDGL